MSGFYITKKHMDRINRMFQDEQEIFIFLKIIIL